MKAIVTGGEGFIGSNVVQYLKERDCSVVTVDIKYSADFVMDVRDTDNLIRVFSEEKPDIIFHLAAIADARKYLKEPVESTNTNISGTVSVFEAARCTKVPRVMLASTCWVAGALGEGLVNEDSFFSPKGAGHIYTSSKIASELIAHDYYHTYEQAFTILRYGNPYGPGMWSGLVVRTFLDRIANNLPLQVFHDGSATRRFLYVADLARAHYLALNPIATNKVYHIEGVESVPISQVISTIEDVIGYKVDKEYVEMPTRKGEWRLSQNTLSTDLAYKELGWKTSLNLYEGIKLTVDWYNENIQTIPSTKLSKIS